VVDFELHSIEPIFAGHVFSVERRHLSADSIPFDREIVTHPGAVAVVAVDELGRVVLLEQYRSSLGIRLLEIPAGTCDVKGEELAETAARELAEETGLLADRLAPLGRFLNSPGYCDQQTELFMATGLTDIAPRPSGPEEVDATVRRLPLDQAIEMVLAGDIVDGTTAFGLMLLARRTGA